MSECMSVAGNDASIGKINRTAGNRVTDLESDIIGACGIFAEMDRKRKGDLFPGSPEAGICLDREGKGPVRGRFRQNQGYVKGAVAVGKTDIL